MKLAVLAPVELALAVPVVTALRASGLRSGLLELLDAVACARRPRKSPTARSGAVSGCRSRSAGCRTTGCACRSGWPAPVP